MSVTLFENIPLEVMEGNDVSLYVSSCEMVIDGEGDSVTNMVIEDENVMQVEIDTVGVYV